MNAASILLSALALLSGAVGAGFASGREIIRFFAVHGAMAPAAAACALLTLAFLFLRLCAQMERVRCPTLCALCRLRFGPKLGMLCAGLFFVLCAVTGAAMLCACAEIGALLFPLRHAYAITLAASLIIACILADREMAGLAWPGILLIMLLPVLLCRLMAAVESEACFLPAIAPDLPVRAVFDGMIYGALNAAMLCPMLPALLRMNAARRKKAVLLFALLFGALLFLAVAVCQRHIAEVRMQPMPFVYLSRSLGRSGYLLLCICMLLAAFSTLCAMLLAMRRLLSFSSRTAMTACALSCLLVSLIGFGPLVSSGYPVLGALCAGLLAMLCLPGCPEKT